MTLPICDDQLLKKYKTIWTKIEGLQNIELDTLPVYDNRYEINKKRKYGDKIYTTF